VKILVPLKRVADPDNANKINVSPDGSRVTTDKLDPKPNPFDEYAVETALRLTENGANTKVRLAGDSVMVVAFAPKEASTQLRQALAMGVDSALLFEATDDQLDGGLVARALAKVVEREKPELVVMGKQAVDGDSNQVAQILAELLGWPLSTSTQSIDLAADKKTVTVAREVDGGVMRSRLTLPAVISVADRVVNGKAVTNNVTAPTHTYSDGPRFAPLPMIMAAKKKPITEAPLATLGVATTLETRYVRFELPPARKAGVKVKDVGELIEKLRSEAKVL